MFCFWFHLQGLDHHPSNESESETDDSDFVSVSAPPMQGLEHHPNNESEIEMEDSDFVKPVNVKRGGKQGKQNDGISSHEARKYGTTPPMQVCFCEKFGDPRDFNGLVCGRWDSSDFTRVYEMVMKQGGSTFPHSYLAEPIKLPKPFTGILKNLAAYWEHRELDQQERMLTWLEEARDVINNDIDTVKQNMDEKAEKDRKHTETQDDPLNDGGDDDLLGTDQVSG
ncbi:hypothetical protein LINPERHAP1_LOCUS16034 [Linum perenne]